MPTIQQVLQQAKTQLVASSSASLDAQLLLADILNVNRAYLFAHPEAILSSEQALQYQSSITRCMKGEPVAYVLGRREFYDGAFFVSSDVLIPRPETELLVEIAIEYAKKLSGCRIADVGTGSGAIAVMMAKHVLGADVYALDVSAEALEIAQQNAQQNHAKIQFHHSNLAQALIDENLRVHLLLANLPYIPTAEMYALDVSKFEPHLALDGGADGLDLVRELLYQVPMVCESKALVLLEIGAGQGAKVLEEIREMLGDVEAEVITDYAGHDRIVRMNWRA